MRPRVVIIVGAPRSGTKILRDALAQATGAGCVPYDVNFVWRVGNERHPDDRLDPSQLTPRAARVIRDYVERRAAGDPPVVIEKTVGNALRTPYVAAVFPDATLIHLIRDGVDVVESIRRQWKAPTNWPYVLRKARAFPLHLAPTYATRYAAGLLARRGRATDGEGSWGPRYPGMDGDLASCPLLTVCARQWRWCVESALDELPGTGLPVVDVRYEDLVSDPRGELWRLAGAVSRRASLSAVDRAAKRVTGGSGGRARVSLRADELADISEEIGKTLVRTGYPLVESGPGKMS